MEIKNILVSVEEKVGILTLNNPSKMNAINKDMEKEINWILKQWEEDNQVRCIVITGSGRAFSSGVDITTIKASHELSPSGRRAERREGTPGGETKKPAGVRRGPQAPVSSRGASPRQSSPDMVQPAARVHGQQQEQRGANDMIRKPPIEG